MNKKSVMTTRRGAVALTLSAGAGLAGLHGVANTWRSSIDSALGTTSSKQTFDDKFVSDYATTDELIAQHEKLGRQAGQEGTVVLKNEGNALPLGGAPKVTVLGMGAYYPLLGGNMGSTCTTDKAIDFIAALDEAGVSLNPTMKSVYETLGAIESGRTPNMWGGGETINYKYRPAGFATPYVPSEPSTDVYGMEGGNADYAGSFADYSDAAIVVFSRPGSEGSDYFPGEVGIDTTSTGASSPLGLTTNERGLLTLAKENFKKVIVVINSGTVMEVQEIKDDADVSAMLFVGLPGAYGFRGVVDVLLGEVCPSGRLADTIAADFSQAPAAQNFGDIQLTDTSALVYPDSLMPGLDVVTAGSSFGGGGSTSSTAYIIEAEGIYTGYKYYETRFFDAVKGQGNATGAAGASKGASAWDYANEVTYPFGHGLSYTTFTQTLDSVEVNTADRTITASVTVTNTGSVAGKSVVQLYASVPYTDYDKSNGVEKAAIQLVDFEKTEELAAGDDAQVKFTVDLEALASWDSSAKSGKGGWILDGGTYYFTVGTDAHNAVCNVLVAQGATADGDASLVKTVEVGSEGSVDEESLAMSKNTGVEVVNQLASADVNYYKPGYMTGLSRSDWQGTFPRTYNDLTIDGSKTDEWVKALMNEIYAITENGTVENEKGSGGSLKLSDMAGIDDINDPRWEQLIEEIPLDILIPRITKGGSQSDVIEQIESPLVYQNDGPNGFSGTIGARGLHADDANSDYAMGTMCTETMLGCTFSKQIASEWGKLMGNDGLWSGNYLIWACAGNLHRCCFNGRNFEYFSEDPMLVSGLAAAEVAGASKYGVIVAPKHFAFNDQESMRSGLAQYMTEQRAREGELRAFRAAIEDSGCLGVMTSFSRVGATPVNGSWGLLREILRNEWGFKGILSTDMANNSGYFRAEMCMYGGITMIADFSTGETMTEVLESWPYLTEAVVAKDATLVGYLRQNLIYQLYAFAQSATQNIKTESVTPWWEMALNAGTIGGFGLAAVFAGLYAAGAVKEFKGDAADAEPVASGKEEN